MLVGEANLAEMSESQSAIPGIQETVARMMTRKRGSRRPVSNARTGGVVRCDVFRTLFGSEQKSLPQQS